MTIDDQILINQILDGDTNAFAGIVNRYKDLVYTVALRMLKNKEEAEEVAQDTFIKIYKSLSKFKGDSKLSTWIYKVAYNTCLDHIKKNRKYINNVEINEVTSLKLDSVDNALDKLEQDERNEVIQRCIESLPYDDSVLLTLYYFEDLSLEDISKIVGMKANAIKVKLFRCRKKLAKLLSKSLEPEIIESYGKAHR